MGELAPGGLCGEHLCELCGGEERPLEEGGGDGEGEGMWNAGVVVRPERTEVEDEGVGICEESRESGGGVRREGGRWRC